MKRKLHHKSLRLHESQDALEKARNKIERLAERESKLRSIVLDNSGAPDAYDSDFLELYGHLRRRLLAVARNELICLDDYHFQGLPDIDGCSLDTEQLYCSLSSTNARNRPYILQAFLFQVVHDRILTAGIFGLGQAFNIKAPQVSTCDHLEASLQCIEHLMLQDQGALSSFSSM